MNFGTEFWSAICGAVVGGLIALVAQLIAIKSARKDRLAEKKEVKIALAHSLIFKVARINSNLYCLHLHIEEAFAKVDARSHTEPWSFVLPLASLPDDVIFSPEEMSIALSLDIADLTDKIMSLDAIHNNLIDFFELYRHRRAELETMLPANMHGNTGTTTLTEEQMALARPQMVILNQLVQDTRIRAQQDYEESIDVLNILIDALNEKFGLTLKMEFKAEKIAALKEVKKQ
nr:hypothetical protein [uncultured Cohaesibacter sp.]